MLEVSLRFPLFIFIFMINRAAKAYTVLNALVSSKLAAQQLCCSTYMQSFSKGGLMGLEAATTQHLEAYVAELKSIATKCPDIEIIKQKVPLWSDTKILIDAMPP